ncbi:flippase [Megasphaera paucivorans]|uniref:Polysaccharide transporter, PST family n=1 Tax=Megasphaera paucivorans TaxID=349095 RepID=A0A1G9PV54_9FIRM|nr:flippase [Megasphaera paucivorans]SDM02658.1 polysaccharide transporter, PST family [Megasphaera paucivorans]
MKKNRLMENIFSMLTLRGMEYILAFILVPYLLRILGPTQYGAVVFMQGIVAYINIIIDYGFTLTAPKAIVNSDKKSLGIVFSSYFWGKIFLWIGISLIICVIYTFSKLYFSVSWDINLFMALYCSVIGNAIFPVWFFQGIQQMRYITFFNFVGRVLSMICIFLFVTGPADYVLAGLLQSIVPLLAGILSIMLICRNYPNLVVKPSIKNCVTVYREGWKIFVSMIAVNLYTTSNVVILGILTNNTVVGYYSGADKLINCVRRGIDAVNTAIYPYITQVLKKSRTQGMLFLKKQLYIYSICGGIVGIILTIGSRWIVIALLGEQYEASIRIFQIMAFVPCIVAVSTIFGGETMLPLGMEKEYSFSLCLGALINTLLIFPLTIWFNSEGTAITTVVTESAIAVIMGRILWKKKILLRD